MSYHQIRFEVRQNGGEMTVTINGRPVADVTRWSIIVEPPARANLQVEVIKRDEQGQRVPERDADGQVRRAPRMLITSADGAPVLAPDGRFQFADGAVRYEREVLRGIMDLGPTTDLVITGILPLTAGNLELAEALTARVPVA